MALTCKYTQIHAITIKYTHHFWLHIPVDKYIKNMQAYANIHAGADKWLQILLNINTTQDTLILKNQKHSCTMIGRITIYNDMIIRHCYTYDTLSMDHLNFKWSRFLSVWPSSTTNERWRTNCLDICSGYITAQLLSKISSKTSKTRTTTASTKQ